MIQTEVEKKNHPPNYHSYHKMKTKVRNRRVRFHMEMFLKMGEAKQEQIGTFFVKYFGTRIVYKFLS